MKGTAVERIVDRLPMASIRGPPAMPPTSAERGIKLPIQEACDKTKTRHD